MYSGFFTAAIIGEISWHMLVFQVSSTLAEERQRLQEEMTIHQEEYKVKFHQVSTVAAMLIVLLKCRCTSGHVKWTI